MAHNAALPDGEPERGFCHTCPIARECPQHLALQKSIENGLLPEVVRLELECEVEELAAVEGELEPLQQRVSELRDRIKTTLQDLGAGKVTLDSGVAQMVASSRTSFDSKSLQREAPDLYQRFLRTSTYSNLRVTFKGENQ